MLPAWPSFLAHVAIVLRPRLDEVASRSAGRQLLDAIDAEVPGLLAGLPPLPEWPPVPPAAEFAGVLRALDGYRKTSPEMVVVGRLIRDALPAP